MPNIDQIRERDDNELWEAFHGPDNICTHYGERHYFNPVKRFKVVGINATFGTYVRQPVMVMECQCGEVEEQEEIEEEEG